MAEKEREAVPPTASAVEEATTNRGRSATDVPADDEEAVVPRDGATGGSSTGECRSGGNENEGARRENGRGGASDSASTAAKAAGSVDASEIDEEAQSVERVEQRPPDGIDGVDTADRGGWADGLAASESIYRDANVAVAAESDQRAPDTIWRDILSCVDHAEFVYTLVNIRNAAREGKVSDRILRTPFPLVLALQILEDNDELIEDFYGQVSKAKKKKELKRLRGEGEEVLREKADPIREIRQRHVSSIRSGVFFVEIDDEKQDEEMVYYIFLSHPRKCVFVVCRGSTTANDWKTDLKVKMETVENPASAMGSDQTIGLHRGFHDYLLKPVERDSSEWPRSKLDAMFATVKVLMDENPGYELACAGHSLGAALSTLFAFYAAAKSEALGIRSAVKCIIVGCPKIGDSRFAEAFESLEKSGKLLHIRIRNDADPVPMMPRRELFCRGRYRDVGICLLLYDRPKWWYDYVRTFFNPLHWLLLLLMLAKYKRIPSFAFHKKKRSRIVVRPFVDLWCDLRCTIVAFALFLHGPDFSKFHSANTYRRRLIAIGNTLATMTYDDIYKGHGIIKIG